LETVPDGVYHLDRSWQITYVNGAFEGMLGRASADMIGQHYLQAFPLARGTLLEESFAQVFADGRPRTFEYRHQPWDHWFEIRAYPDSLGLTVFVRDIDERLRAERRREAEMRELTSVLESLPAATVLVGEDGRIVSTNRAWTANGEFLRATGVRPGGVGDDYLGCMARGIDADDHTTLAAGLQRLRAGTCPEDLFDHEYSSRLADHHRWFRLQASRVGDTRQIVVSHIDITDQILSE
jgi:PAS domain S-box-containing protein